MLGTHFRVWAQWTTQGATAMERALAAIDSFISGIVFGNGWLAFGGLSAVILFTVAVRLSKGIDI